MKKSVFILLFLLFIGFFVKISIGSAEENLFRISPVLEKNISGLLLDSLPGNPIILTQVAEGDETIPDEGFDEDFFDEYDDEVEEVQMVADPLYYFNYAMYSFNDFFYFYALKPVALGYKYIAPVPLRNGVNNFFYNLLFPVRFVNNLLQGKLLEASDEIGVFLTNSTLGVLGFNQFAQKHLNMKTSNEDLGQTLGSYAIGDGFYLVLPILGPSTLRDALGRAGDYFITPVNYVEPWELNLGIYAYDQINRTTFRIGDYEALKDASLDPYVALRNAYIQNRRSKIEK